MGKGKDRLKRLLGPRLMSWYNHLRLRLQVLRIFLSDYRRYRRHSAYYHPETREALELQIIVAYHSLEKGFLHRDRLRRRFGREKVSHLLQLLQRWQSEGHPTTSQVIAAEEILSAYYSYHRDKGVDIGDYFAPEDYRRLTHHATRTVREPEKDEREEEGRRGDFAALAHSRHSIRRFTTRPVTPEELRPVITLAATAPSACNRQETRVHLISDRERVQTILDLQGGFRSEREGIHQLLLVTTDLSYTYMEGMDRQQPYIDGGIYLMSLLYALHYYGIAACTGNASLLPRDERRILRLAQAAPSEALVAVVVIGYAEPPRLTTLSRRRPAEETLYAN